jgi:hypothetical protein
MWPAKRVPTVLEGGDKLHPAIENPRKIADCALDPQKTPAIRLLGFRVAI